MRVFPVIAKREEIKGLEYLVNPTRSEFWGFFEKNKFKVGNWREEPDEGDPGDTVWFVRGILDDKKNLYVWNPYEVNHGSFAKYLGLDYMVPIYLTGDKMVYISDYDGHWDSMPPKAGNDTEEIMNYVSKVKSLKTVLGNDFAVDFECLY